MHRFIITYIIICFGFFTLWSQEKWTISGQIVTNKQQAIENVAVSIDKDRGTISAADGTFTLSTSQSKIRLTLSHTQYIPQAIYLQVNRDTTLKIVLLEDVIEIDEIKIEGEQGDFVKNKVPGMSSIKQADIQSQPSILGIPDVITSLQRGVGIQSVNEGVSGIYVRGGDAGQNLIIYDDIELVDPSHLMGTYSVFNPYLVERVDLYKGNAPIEYTGRLSSSIVVHSFENTEKLPTLTANIGTLASSIALAYQKDKIGFVLGARRTQLELYKQAAMQVAPHTEGFLNNNNYAFYDHNGKVYYHTGNKDRLSLSWYTGGDDLRYGNNTNLNVGIAWQNKGAALNWKHTSDQCAANTTLGLTDYSFNFDGEIMDYQANFETAYRSYYIKNTLKRISEKHLLSFNTKAYLYAVQPQSGQVNNSINNYDTERKYTSSELIISLADRWEVNEELSIYYALGLSNYLQLGPQTYTTVQGQDSSFVHYDKQEIIAHYPSLSPQLFITWERPYNLAYKWAYSFSNQNIHRGSLATLPLPADIWIPSTKYLKPETSQQISMGAFKSYADYDFSAEVYGRKMNNILLFEANLTGELKANFEENFKAGEGYALGLELLARKNTGAFTGWVAYTLAKSQKRIQGIANNQWFDSKYDRVHDLSIVANYSKDKRWDFSLAFVLASGNKATVPAGRYLMMGYIMNDYTSINSFRMPIYHRLDLSANYHLKPRYFKKSTLNFSIINAYNRKNTYFFFYEVRGNIENYQMTVAPNQFSLFPILPTISWTFAF